MARDKKPASKIDRLLDELMEDGGGRPSNAGNRSLAAVHSSTRILRSRPLPLPQPKPMLFPKAVIAPPVCRCRAYYLTGSASTITCSGPRSTACFRALGSATKRIEEYRSSRAENAILASMTASGAPRQ